MKKILGLDLGTTSIGWAIINEPETDKEQASINRLGVRVIPLTTDEETNFEQGKPITTNAQRTLDRSARRNLQRYKLRREKLLAIFKRETWIPTHWKYAESGDNSTFNTLKLRARAATQEISLEELAKVLLHINKKRGYRSSRKLNSEEDGEIIDDLGVAKILADKKITPGEYLYEILLKKRRSLPTFYRSDLVKEFKRIWEFQSTNHPNLLNSSLWEKIEGKNRTQTTSVFKALGIYTLSFKGSRAEKQLEEAKLRASAIKKSLTPEELATVLTMINNDLTKSSDYLGDISDRSKQLYFKKQTIGEYLYEKIKQSRHNKLRGEVFYRQDYLDEFDQIWQTQSLYHPKLTEQLRKEIGDETIFYQRPLRSQKHLISFCELERKTITIEKNGKSIKKEVGLRVVPKSSPLFQVFKIWHNLASLKLTNLSTNQEEELSTADKKDLFEELNIKGNLKAKDIFKILGLKPKEWKLNFEEIQGNLLNERLYQAYLKMLDLEGNDLYTQPLKKRGTFDLKTDKLSAREMKTMVADVFKASGIEHEILDFNPYLSGNKLEKQPSYQLWHLLYSYESDASPSGNETLYELLQEKYGFTLQQAKILAAVPLPDDYGNLSAKAIRKILPYLEEDTYDKACDLAGYNHSRSSITKEENETRVLEERLELLPKNSLRNPVVEKILNQMINVVNCLIEEEKQKTGNQPFNFDEIRVELARELKSSKEERDKTYKGIQSGTKRNDKIREILRQEFKIALPSRNDLIRYRLYEELAPIGYKDLYTGVKINREELFSKNYEIDHIIPQALLFDDSFSNKVLVPADANLEKGKRTAYDYIQERYGDQGIHAFLGRISMLNISPSKQEKLKKKESDLDELDFIERDLRNTQYIAKKAKDILLKITREVTATSGAVTDKLRSDWDLTGVMKELTLPIYQKLDLTKQVVNSKGQQKEIILNWSKRDDHRHHAMDALTVAFTHRDFIHYLNHLHAKTDVKHKYHASILSIKNKWINKGKFLPPMPHFRSEAKRELNQTLISFATKNKVVTPNTNRIKLKKGIHRQETLTPRGQLHKETVYGSENRIRSEVKKINSKFTEEVIQTVANPVYRELLLKRLHEHDNNPKKAFGGKNTLSKNPIYLDDAHSFAMPQEVKLVWKERIFTIRKEVNPTNFATRKNIEKVVDLGIREKLLKRLEEFNGNPKEAFANLDTQPIWLNKEKGISIKRATITGVNKVEALHIKKDHFGEPILTASGKEIASSFVSTGNNHHVAIFEDDKGNYQEQVVSLFDAVERVNAGLPVIDKEFNKDKGWKFLFTMKQNEMFVFPTDDFNPNEIDLQDPINKAIISPHLFRVQKIASKDYCFRHHLDTSVQLFNSLKDINWIRVQTVNNLKGIIKVRINHTGKIVHVGEY